MLLNIVVESWHVLCQMAPYLLFGFLIAGVLSVCISPEWVERHLGGDGIGPVLKASLFGVPLPLCSCGVIPVSASFYRHGASKAATTSFLLSTPQTGVDSILVTYSMLGPVFAIFRPLAALFTGFIGGGLVQFFDKPQNESPNHDNSVECKDDCCIGKGKQNVFSRIFNYSFVTLPNDISNALIIGILIAGLIAAFVPQDYLTAYIGGGILSIIILMIIGVPIYVCASASVPIAAGFMYMGASPGAALAFLIAGPATNAVTFTTIYKVLGKRSAILYMITVALSAIIGGLILNWLVPFSETLFPQVSDHNHLHSETGMLSNIWAIILLIVLFYSYISMSFRKKENLMKTENDQNPAANHHHLEIEVSGMTCSHCAESVRRAVAEQSGVHSVDVNLKNGKVKVTGDNFDNEKLATVITELGFTAKLINE